MSAQHATFRKLFDGTWGIRVPGTATAGDQVFVRKASGEVKLETVAGVVSTDGTTTLCRIARDTAQQPRPVTRIAQQRGAYAASKRRGRPFRPCGYPGCNPNFCDECDGKGFYGQ